MKSKQCTYLSRSAYHYSPGLFSRRQIGDIFSYFFFPKNRIWHFMQIVTISMKMSILFLGKIRKSFKYSRHLLSRIPRDSLKYFEISIPWHIGFSELRKKIRTTTFNKYICNLTPELRDILKILWKRGEIAPQEQFLLFSTTFLLVVRFSCLGSNQIFTSR